jgi:Putative MetA-pathway of phenol degradation
MITPRIEDWDAFARQNRSRHHAARCGLSRLTLRHGFFGLLLLLAWLASGRASAQAPFYTDDTVTTEVGTLHIEAFDEIDGLQSRQYPNLRQDTANLKVNFGLPYGLELDIDAPYLIIDRAAGSPSSRGLGDTDFGIKWNMHTPEKGSRIPAFALSFYTEFPTGNTSKELGSGVADYWLNFMMQEPLAESTRFNVNLGILFAGNTSTGVVGIETKRGHVFTGGLSLMHDLNAKLTLGAEVYGGISDNSGVDRTQLQVMLGAQYGITDLVTVYGGLISGTYTASPKIGGQIGFAVDFPHFFHSRRSSQLSSTRTFSSERPSFHLQRAGEPDEL